MYTDLEIAQKAKMKKMVRKKANWPLKKIPNGPIFAIKTGFLVGIK